MNEDTSPEGKASSESGLNIDICKEILDEFYKGEKNLEELIPTYTAHRAKYDYRDPAFQEIMYQYEQKHVGHDHWYVGKAFGDKYNMHNEEETITKNPYWDTIVIAEWYSKTRYQRFKEYLMKKHSDLTELLQTKTIDCYLEKSNFKKAKEVIQTLMRELKK